MGVCVCKYGVLHFLMCVHKYMSVYMGDMQRTGHLDEEKLLPRGTIAVHVSDDKLI